MTKTSGQSKPKPISLPMGDNALWTQPFNTTELELHLSACRAAAANTTEKGTRLEHLVCWLFSHIPGFTVVESNVFSEDGSQEIDVIILNEQQPGGFTNYGNHIFVECKNWAKPVDSKDVAWFDWKMRLGGVTEGILLAANGITGKASRREAAVSILTTANSETKSRKILVVTLDDVEALTSRNDLTQLLKRKATRLVARAPFQ